MLSGSGRRSLGRWLPALVLAVSAAWAMDFARLEQLLLARFGPAQLPLLRDLQQALVEARPAPERAKLARVNDFINRRIRFEDDLAIWSLSDYWATPLETIGQGSGDCEDFAIIKYYSLREAGIPLAKLRLIYVKASLQGPNGPYQQAHMVLAYYPTPNAVPLVLDNLVTEILPASQRQDLQPVFSFNSEAIWSGAGGNAAKGTGGTSQLSRWQNLLQRARKEGVD
ncbi:MAG: transglutaminase-like cysteine peptidase [Sulfuritalea sp.]|nr:transglutaminase-like cysteine peptidase [Sulfuritalea sp.]